MLDDTLTATSFAPDAADGPLPGRAQVVIVGGGIAGSSIAYHLAGLGITDVLLLERARIASGTSWHAAGLVARVRGSHPMTELANYGVDLYRGLAEETGVDVHFRPTGSLTLAENDGRMTELRYAAAIARHHGIEARLLEPAEVPEVWPLISTDGLVGALLQPGDGTVNPGYAALALAKGAHDRGVTIREGVRVSALLTEDGSVTGVRTDRGDVEAETVVLACGLWTRDLAATVGVPVPLYAAEHVHVSTEPIEGAHDLLPLVRGLDGSFYARHHAGGLMIGAFEPNGRPRSTASIPEDWAFGEFGPDWEHFAPTRANATRRIPALEARGVHAVPPRPGVLHPRCQLLPRRDRRGAQPLRGRRLQLAGDHLLAGCGARARRVDPRGSAHVRRVRGRRPALRVVAGERALPPRAHEGSPRTSVRDALAEPPGDHGARHPALAPLRPARGGRRVLRRARAVGARRSGSRPRAWSPSTSYSFGRQNWFPYAAEEHRAAREAVALFDLSSFAKIEVTGPDALRLLQHVCTNDVDVAVGTARLHAVPERVAAASRTTGRSRASATTDSSCSRPRPRSTARSSGSAPHGRGMSVTIDRRHERPRDARRDGTAEPGAARPPHLRRTSRTRASRSSRRSEIQVASAPALAIRASFVGELGWELYVPSEFAVHVYDAIVEAGADLGLRHAGYHALDSLRIEKGFVHVGHDVGPTDDPFTAGLGHVVKLDKEFVGVEAARRAKRDARPASPRQPEARGPRARSSSTASR